MTFKLNLVLGPVITLCVAAFLNTYVRAPIFEASALGEDQKEQKKGSETVPDNERVQKTHTDLGGGLELFETTEFRNGDAVSHVKIFKRHGAVVMEHSSVPRAGHDVRTYYRNGKQIMAEIIGKDRHIDVLILVDEEGNPIEEFERKKDGTTLPVSTERLEKEKRGAKFIRETFGPIAEAVKNGDEKKAQQRIDEAIKKAMKARAEGIKPSPDDNKPSK